MSRLTSIGILISGRGSNMEAILKACKSNDINAFVSVVISDNAQARGISTAKKYGIKTFVLEPNAYESKKDYEDDIDRILKNSKAELVCLAGYMRVIGKTLLNEYKNRMINIHPSLLPSFKGLNAQQQALNYGVKYTGCTVHYVNDILDGGEIIMQAVVPVLENDSLKSLSHRILDQEHKLYIEAIELIIKSGVLKREEVL